MALHDLQGFVSVRFDAVRPLDNATFVSATAAVLESSEIGKYINDFSMGASHPVEVRVLASELTGTDLESSARNIRAIIEQLSCCRRVAEVTCEYWID